MTAMERERRRKKEKRKEKRVDNQNGIDDRESVSLAPYCVRRAPTPRGKSLDPGGFLGRHMLRSSYENYFFESLLVKIMFQKRQNKKVPSTWNTWSFHDSDRKAASFVLADARAQNCQPAHQTWPASIKWALLLPLEFESNIVEREQEIYNSFACQKLRSNQTSKELQMKKL
jgi:hypothetical protein